MSAAVLGTEFSADAALRERAAAARRLLDQAAADTEALKSDLAAHRAEADARRQKYAAAVAAAARPAAEAGPARPSLRETLERELALYRAITNITWAPDCGDGVLAGIVRLDEAHIAKRFSIDTNAKSEFDVAQELWALLDSGKDMY